MKEIWNYCCYRIRTHYELFHDSRGQSCAVILGNIIGINFITALLLFGIHQLVVLLLTEFTISFLCIFLFSERTYLEMKKKYKKEPQRLRRIRGWAIVAYIIGSFVFFGVACYIKRG